MKKREYPQAIAAYKKLLQLIEADSNANPNHRITCLARLADMYARSGDCAKTLLIKTRLLKDNYYSQDHKNEEVGTLIERLSGLCAE